MAAARRRKSPSVLFTLLILIVAFAAVGTGVLLLLNTGPDESDIAVMEQRLRDLRQLRTVTRTYRSVIYVEERNFWRGSKEVLFTLDYEVTAGVDFSRGLDITELSRGTFQVAMPPAEVFSSDAVESSIREMILREKTLFNPISMGDYMPHVIAQGAANRQSAIDSGILEQAESNAREAVLRVLRLGNVDDVVFTVPDTPGGSNG